jgi:hypothetical protein
MKKLFTNEQIVDTLRQVSMDARGGAADARAAD